MVIKSHTDDAGAVRDLLDCYFFKRFSDRKRFQAVRKPDLDAV